MKPTDSSVLDEGHAGQRKYIGTLSNKFGNTMPHYMPHLHYPEKEPLVIKLYRKLDLNGYEDDKENSLRQLVQPFPFFFKFVII